MIKLSQLPSSFSTDPQILTGDPALLSASLAAWITPSEDRHADTSSGAILMVFSPIGDETENWTVMYFLRFWVAIFTSFIGSSSLDNTTLSCYCYHWSNYRLQEYPVHSLMAKKWNKNKNEKWKWVNLLVELSPSTSG